jgi:hypothetical protein
LGSTNVPSTSRRTTRISSPTWDLLPGNEAARKALELLERAQKADPPHWQSLYNIVIVAGLEMGRAELAEAALVKLRTSQSGSPQPRTAQPGAREDALAGPDWGPLGHDGP